MEVQIKGFVDIRIDCCQDLTPPGIFRMCESAWYNGVVKWYPTIDTDAGNSPEVVKAISTARAASRYVEKSIPGIHLKSRIFDWRLIRNLKELSKLVKLITLTDERVTQEELSELSQDLDIIVGSNTLIRDCSIVDASVGLVSPEALKNQINSKGPEKTIIVTNGMVPSLKAVRILFDCGFRIEQILAMMSENPIDLLGLDFELDGCAVNLAVDNKGYPVLRRLMLNFNLILQ